MFDTINSTKGTKINLKKSLNCYFHQDSFKEENPGWRDPSFTKPKPKQIEYFF